MRKDDTMTAPTDALRALLERAFEVVHHDIDCPAIGGKGDDDCQCDAVPFLRDLETALATPASPITINHDGIDRKLIDDATPAGSASGEVPFAVVGGVEFDSPQALCAAHADLQAEVARLRELLRRAQPCVRHTAGNVAQRLGMDYAKSDYELLAAIDAAMGSANGQADAADTTAGEE